MRNKGMKEQGKPTLPPPKAINRPYEAHENGSWDFETALAASSVIAVLLIILFIAYLFSWTLDIERIFPYYAVGLLSAVAIGLVYNWIKGKRKCEQ